MEHNLSSDMLSHRRNLLICFDAFGTLFKPKRPIAQQYAEVATSLGLRKFSEEEVQRSFKAAFKNESKRNPNYGKANGMNAEKWWTNIIHNTFKPLIGISQNLPTDLATKLLHRFSSAEGYEPQPHAHELLRDLRDTPPPQFDRVVVGVVTNSDDRVPNILTSLGLRVGSLRYGVQAPPQQQRSASKREDDVDFTVMSYDVGHEKPDVRIFQAADEMLNVTLRSRGESVEKADAGSWEKIYVGDEYDKDVFGARNAGWHTVLVGGESLSERSDVRWLDDGSQRSLMDILRSETGGAAFRNLRELQRWLVPAC